MRTASSPPPGAVIALPRWQRYGIYVTVFVLAATGAGWLLAAWPQEEAASSPSMRTAALWLLRAHGVAAYALLVVAGSVLPVHVRLGWLRHRNRWSGAALVGLLIALAATGLWLYYGPEAGRDTASILHWAIGMALPVWLLLHRAWGLGGRRRRLGPKSAVQRTQHD